jgi:hypothetical protein
MADIIFMTRYMLRNNNNNNYYYYYYYENMTMKYLDKCQILGFDSRKNISVNTSNQHLWTSSTCEVCLSYVTGM